MVQQIPLSSPDITDLERSAVLDVLSSPQLSLGPRLPEFERALCERTGSRYAVAVNSGTSALHLCVKALGIGPGDEVITTPFSFVASANCVLFERARPVFVDIDPVTWNIDVEQIEHAITPRTRAILPVHVFGRPANMRAIMEIANRRNLAVIEDSCEAIGASIDGKAAGTFGNAGVFAFYPNKQITTGEGGAVITDDPKIASLCRSWRNQGRGEGASWLQHEMLGYNYRLSDVNCALGIAQLQRLSEICEARTMVAARYNAMLADLDGVIVPSLREPGAEISWFVYVVRLTDDFSRKDRDAILARLRERGVGCNNYFTPIHLQPFYREQFGFAPGDFPITEHIADRTIALPFFNQLTADQAALAVRELHGALESVERASQPEALSLVY
jgi:perosamine synthetase